MTDTGPGEAPAPTPIAASGPVRSSGGGWRVWARTIHIYASLLGLVLALFFGSTGFVMNHGTWFGLEDKRTETVDAQLPPDTRTLDRLGVVERVRARFDVAGGLTVYEADPDLLRLRFSRPGEESEVLIDLPGCLAHLSRERRGIAAVLTDLHKGEGSGRAGKLVIDATAILLVTISITGFVLWLTLPKRRRLGLAALVLALGLLGCVGAVVFG